MAVIFKGNRMTVTGKDAALIEKVMKRTGKPHWQVLGEALFYGAKLPQDQYNDFMARIEKANTEKPVKKGAKRAIRNSRRKA